MLLKVWTSNLERQIARKRPEIGKKETARRRVRQARRDQKDSKKEKKRSGSNK